MATRSYWIDLFSGSTWQQFLERGADVSGFRDQRWKTVQQMKPGDYLLCYLTGVSRWIGILEVVSEPFKDAKPLWSENVFPCRVKVKPVIALTPETAIPIMELRDQLSFFQNLKSPAAWTGYFRGSPAKLNESDGEAIVNALMMAEKNPVVRSVDPAKLRRRPPTLEAKMGPVTVPDSDESQESIREPSLHSEVQFLLLKLGSDMGLDVWVAQNDRSRQVNGQSFAKIPRVKSKLPVQFDEATNKTISLIDVLWLEGNAIVAAFEIECTTSIYSGLLRMSDLIAMQPNINIPLYLVAPDERREKVFNEVNRPTFSRLSPPMREMCKFLSIPVLRERISQVSSVVRYLKPEFLEELSETCDIEEP